MGSVLRQRFGPDMVIFGFDFDHGSFNAIGMLGYDSPTDYINLGLAAQTIPAGPDDGWEKFFATANRPRFFLDVRNPSSAEAKTYLAGRQKMWFIGAGWNGIYRYYRPYTALPDRYDVIIYVQTTTASQLRR